MQNREEIIIIILLLLLKGAHFEEFMHTCLAVEPIFMFGFSLRIGVLFFVDVFCLQNLYQQTTE